ncbi:MAG: hypothetical protein AAFY71_28500 [Bacteroidota bacterium]
MKKYLLLFLIYYLAISPLKAQDKLVPIPDLGRNYALNRDFDGDKVEDYMSFQFSGGAHCCYKLILKLSTRPDSLKYPFEMDGGFSIHLKGSTDGHFKIADYDNDCLPEILMQIGTYNGEAYALEDSWKKDYGISSHYILFDYSEGRMKVMDVDPQKHQIKRIND